jgi:hypothetical protein
MARAAPESTETHPAAFGIAANDYGLDTIRRGTGRQTHWQRGDCENEN